MDVTKNNSSIHDRRDSFPDHHSISYARSIEKDLQDTVKIQSYSFHTIASKNGKECYVYMILSGKSQTIDFDVVEKVELLQKRVVPLIKIKFFDNGHSSVTSLYGKCPYYYAGVLSLFRASVSGKNIWSLGPEGWIYAAPEMKGVGIMSHIFGLLVREARSSGLNSSCSMYRKVRLSLKDAEPEAHRLSRNRFYQRCGFNHDGKPDFEDLEEGYIDANVDDLNDDGADNERIYSIFDPHEVQILSKYIFGNDDLKDYDEIHRNYQGNDNIHSLILSIEGYLHVHSMKNEISVLSHEISSIAKKPFLNGLLDFQKSRKLKYKLDLLEQKMNVARGRIGNACKILAPSIESFFDIHCMT